MVSAVNLLQNLPKFLDHLTSGPRMEQHDRYYRACVTPPPIHVKVLAEGQNEVH